MGVIHFAIAPTERRPLAVACGRDINRGGRYVTALDTTSAPAQVTCARCARNYAVRTPLIAEFCAKENAWSALPFKVGDFVYGWRRQARVTAFDHARDEILIVFIGDVTPARVPLADAGKLVLVK